ncbi:alpha/beta fold hydrolase [Romboutsia sp.]|uniref:alpha/beta fold hydrolase n=1 Tax=Romboutsia sp. TaxID=1965302 RepID=UPI003F378498
MEKKYIKNERGKVIYWINNNNSNKTIMFTHGVTADHTLFDKQLDFWCKEYTVITWDMPLHGESRPYKKSELFWTKHFSDIAKLYPYNYYCKVSSESTTMTEESKKSFYDNLLRLGKEGMLDAANAVYKDFYNYEEVDFKCPVLLLIGEYDKTGYVKKYNDMWAKETGFSLVVIPNASHNSNFDNYYFFNNKVYEFLNS